MSVSLEALAMAGMDSGQWGIDVDEWESQDSDQYPPPYLLADEPDEQPTWVHNFGFLYTNQVVLSHRRKAGGHGEDDDSFKDITGAGSESSEEIRVPNYTEVRGIILEITSRWWRWRG